MSPRLTEFPEKCPAARTGGSLVVVARIPALSPPERTCSITGKARSNREIFSQRGRLRCPHILYPLSGNSRATFGSLFEKASLMYRRVPRLTLPPEGLPLCGPALSSGPPAVKISGAHSFPSEFSAPRLRSAPPPARRGALKAFQKKNP